MKKLFLLIWVISIVLSGCKKKDSTPTVSPAPPVIKDNILSENTIIVSNDVINNSLVSVDSTKLTFTTSGSGVDKIKVGSILVSDVSTIAPIGFLRKVTGITTVSGNKVCTTEQASLTDAIVKGKVTYNRLFTDSDIIGEDSSGIDISAQQRVQGLSFVFNYNKIIYDADGNSSTTYDQIKFNGEMKIEPTFDFELDIDGSRVKKFVAKMALKNTSKISAESKVILASLKREIVLKTFHLNPFTISIAGVPIPIAKQWIAIVLGMDGSLAARVTAGAQNINTAIAGLSYENNSWSTINTQDNSFSSQPLTFEGATRVEPWIQVRYEIRPYGIKASRIYVGVRGSVIGEATLSSAGLDITTKWGVKFSAKAQMQIWDRAVLDYEKIFYEKEFLISQSTAFAFPSLTTLNATGITQIAAQSGGNITSDGGASVTVRGVCWSTSSYPTIANNKTANGTGTGSFTSSLTGLNANTSYHVRAYATNSAGTAYGNEITFITQSAPVVTMPIVTTTALSGITQTTVQSGGNITSDGNATVTARGVCWSTTTNPTIANNKTTDGTGTGSFTSSITGLTANTIYNVRAYATNSAGTAYGSNISFTTLALQTGGATVTDIDGNVYKTVTIGTQVWMAENLRVTRYRNGDALAAIGDDIYWVLSDIGAYTYYADPIIYGNFYNYYAVGDPRNICPVGWHVPSDAEWTTLTSFLGGESIAGDKMKATTLWYSPHTAATNESGFTGLPAGYRDGEDLGLRKGYGYKSYWWSSTTVSSFYPWVRSLVNDGSNVGRSNVNKWNGFSIRCIKD